MMFAKQRNCLICGNASFQDRQICIHNLMHSGFYLVDKFLRQVRSALHGEIIAVSYGIMNHHFINILLSGNIIDCL